MTDWQPSYDREPERPWDGLSPNIGEPLLSTDPDVLFDDLTRRLLVRFRFDRAVMIVRSGQQQHLLAVASCGSREGNKRLRLQLPLDRSLVARVAESGYPYSESYCGFYSGNDLERRLLLDDSAQSFAMVPVKCEGRVVGVLGFSSKDPEAFRLLENTDWDRIASPLGACIAHQP